MAERPQKTRRIDHILRDRHESFYWESEIGRHRQLEMKKILETYHLHPSRMHRMGQWLKSVVPIQWLRVFAIDYIPYRALVLEFLSTISTHLDGPQTEITFQLGGTMRYCSLKEFAQRLGIYTQEECEHSNFGSWPQIEQHMIQEFKMEICKNRTYKVAYMRDVRHRILHQLISTAVFGFNDLEGKIKNTDLRIMYSMLKEQHLCPAMYIAKACEWIFTGGKFHDDGIGGGKFVTQLANSYGLLTDDFVKTLEPIGRVHHLNISTDRGITYSSEPEYKYWILEHDAEPINIPFHGTNLEAAPTEPTKTVTDVTVPIEVREPLIGITSIQEASSSSKQKGKAVLEIPDFPQEPVLLDSPLDSTDFPELQNLVMQPNPYFTELMEAINPIRPANLGDSSTQQGAQPHQEILQEAPVVNQPPLTLEDVVKEMRENFHEIGNNFHDVRKDISDLTTWLKNRLSDP